MNCPVFLQPIVQLQTVVYLLLAEVGILHLRGEIKVDEEHLVGGVSLREEKSSETC